MAYSDYMKQRILFYHRSRKNCTESLDAWQKKGTRQAKWASTNSQGATRRLEQLPWHLDQEDLLKLIMKFASSFKEQMQKNDETTALEIKQLLEKAGFDASKSSIRQWRKDLGWTSRALVTAR